MKLESTEIRKQADILLQKKVMKLFTTEDIRLVIHDMGSQDDRGIDFVFEIIKRKDGKTWMKFNVQNKGVLLSENLTPIKQAKNPHKGNLSFKLEKIRHVSYYKKEIAEPIIITICDLQSKKIYWYPIQLDNDIENRTRKQIENNIDSVQIYIDPLNIISKKSIKKLMNDIVQSKIEQNIDYNYTEDYNSILLDIFTKDMIINS